MSWQQEYLVGLQKRGEEEKSHFKLINAYNELADQLAILRIDATTKDDIRAKTPLQPGESDPQTKLELAEALAANGRLQARLKAAEATRDELTARAKSDEKMVKALQSEKVILARKVKDRDEELRGKTQLLVEVQDENMFLTLQLNVAEQKSASLKKENKELVDRWMARMGKEADAMNAKLGT